MPLPQNRIFLFSLGGAVIVIGILATAGLWRGGDCQNFKEGKVSVNGEIDSVALAVEPVEQARGLAGCTDIPKNSGMYFVYDKPVSVAFWMKGMLIAIDIVWIADGVVIGVNDHVPPPAGTTITADLPRYKPPRPVTGVLELAAGEAAKQGIAVGTTITLLETGP